jgi:para-nitrobenzyl esterase
VGYAAPEGFPLGAAHGLELSYLLGAEPSTGAQRITHTGDPNGPATPTWKPFANGDHIQRLAPGAGGIGPVDPDQEGRCELRRSVGLSSPALAATAR